MRKRSIRRSQLIAPFGPGAMVVMRDGTSLIAAGLDHWYKPEDLQQGEYDPTEFFFGEWRLERELGVQYFGLPPDYRARRREWGVGVSPNSSLTVPFLRFPQWHVCPRCQRLERVPLVTREFLRCPSCADQSGTQAKTSPAMVQVRFIALCDRGHIQDFPWREWVHSSARTTCQEPMRLVSTGGASLAAIRIECNCGKKRTLEQVTEADPPVSGMPSNGSTKLPSSYLTRNLQAGAEYRCEGRCTWLGEEVGRGCDRPLRGSLRGATNVYFGVIRSSIYLPREASDLPSGLMEILENPPLSGLIGLLTELGQPVEPAMLRRQHGEFLRTFTDADVRSALEHLMAPTSAEEINFGSNDDQETAFRRAEHHILRTSRDEEQLFTVPQAIEDYGSSFSSIFSRVTLVSKLRETRAFAGFTRVFPENAQSLEERKSMLWRKPPVAQWLPAYIVFGEGIYLELNEERLQRWENRSDVMARAGKLAGQFRVAQERRHIAARLITARQVLLHTLSHLLINQLTFECGYSSASLRERLYVSSDRTAPMAGLLIYTAAGDSEGTMGGLVRMGKPENLVRVLNRAIHNAMWCSSDPVCMELGELGGQGPDSCNLAACHNCALVPETSCEEFNRFLDRGLVIGNLQSPDLGFFPNHE